MNTLNNPIDVVENKAELPDYSPTNNDESNESVAMKESYDASGTESDKELNSEVDNELYDNLDIEVDSKPDSESNNEKNGDFDSENNDETDGETDSESDGESNDMLESLMPQLPKSKRMIDDINKNLSESQSKSFMKELQDSLVRIEGFQSATGVDDESLDEMISTLLTQSRDIINGILSPDYVKGFMRALNYDRDMAMSRQEGVIEGRNTRISQLMKEYEPSDTSPRMPSNNTFTPASNSIFELADSAR